MRWQFWFSRSASAKNAGRKATSIDGSKRGEPLNRAILGVATKLFTAGGGTIDGALRASHE